MQGPSLQPVTGPEPLLHCSEPLSDESQEAAPACTAWAVLREQPLGWIVPSFAALLGFLTGWDVGYIGSMLESDSFKQDINEGRPLTGFAAGLLVGLQSAGAAFASLPFVGGTLMDKIGRRGLIILCGAICAVSSIVQVTSYSIAQICFGRVLLGLSMGWGCVCPVYQSEVAPKEARGAMMSMFPLALALGIFAATGCNFAVQGVSHGWRLVIWPMTFFSTLLSVGMCCCPETPRHLLLLGEEARAREALAWLRRGASPELIEREWLVMQRDADTDRLRGHGSYKALCSGFVLRLLLVAVTGWLLFQLCGMPAFSYYGPKMFKMIRIDAFAFQMVTTGLGFFITFPTLWIIDRFGRKVLLKAGAVAMGLSMLALGIVGTSSIEIPQLCPGSNEPTDCAHSIGYADGQVSAWTQAAIMFFSIVFCGAYSISWGAVMNVFGNEIFPLKFRARCVATGNFAGFVGNFCMGQFTPMLMDGIQFKTFFLFSVFDLLCFCFACWIPETAGAHLEQLVPLFEKRLGLKYSEES